jgi:hypothetical protein
MTMIIINNNHYYIHNKRDNNDNIKMAVEILSLMSMKGIAEKNTLLGLDSPLVLTAPKGKLYSYNLFKINSLSLPKDVVRSRESQPTRSVPVYTRHMTLDYTFPRRIDLMGDYWYGVHV